MIRSAFACILYLLVAGAITVFSNSAWAAPKVMASIKPLHSLVAQIMLGVGEPELLIPGSVSPHLFTLKPSQAAAIQSSDLVFWFGRELESALQKPLASIAGARAIRLLDINGLTLLPVREAGNFEDHDTDHKVGDGHDHQTDPHAWLDTGNAGLVLQKIAATLSKVDPANASHYQANAAQFTHKLAALDSHINALLMPVRHLNTLVFHDAYQYFERRYSLRVVGSVSINPDVPPSAKRVREIQQKLRALETVCVLSEPQFSDKMIRVIAQGSGARHGVVDPIGANIAAGPDQYPQMMRAMAQSLRRCLAG